jgi:hypothetical protein
MREWIWRVGFIVAVLAGSVEASAAGPVTFNKDVLPILQKNCQSCHRPGNIAPMSFLSYETTRPWAKAMKAAVISRKMPPWFADPQYSHFSNDRSLQQNEIDTIAQWVDTGAVQGDPKDAPPAVEWPENGWITKPDIVLKGVPFTVEAAPVKNVIEWMALLTPTGFTKDTWITSVEIKPSELSVTHHICVSFVPHRPDAVYNTFLWVDKQRDESGAEVPPSDRKLRIPTADGRGREIAAAAAQGVPAGNAGAGAIGVGFTCYVPGKPLNDYRHFNAGLLVPAGYDVSWNIHYTPNGAKVTDKPEVGLTVAKEQPQRLLITSAVALTNFAVPPNEGNYETPPGEFTFLADAELHWMSPHMHLRGKDMKYKIVFPDGREQVVLNVPHYDFNWQLGYELAAPIKVPAGSKLVVVAHYDNSANNKFNPDPNRTVYNGNMTWEEMFAPFFAITVDKSVDPAKAVRPPRSSFSGGA